MYDYPFDYIPKEQWQDQTPSFVPNLRPPVYAIVFGYPQMFYAPKGKADLAFNPSPDRCLSEVQFMQKMDMRKYPDIKYNFVISPDGKVYEGRGWRKVPSLPLRHKALSFHCYYISFIGDFVSNPPSEKLFELRNKLIMYGVQKKVITEKFLLLTFRNNVNSSFDSYDFKNESVTLSKY